MIHASPSYEDDRVLVYYMLRRSTFEHEFSAILSYIQANYSHVKIRELAERFHYSERQITRIVQNCTGQSFEALVTRLRMERTALLLKNTDTPIGKISQDAGYATISSFYRIFAATYACTPAAYRAKHKTT